ncbi:MAG TPA: adenylate/guanylate cyclase domain-containing protein [Planctomycetaceae bacterium]|nr:adenylate/guanylate cyclase domain-containing protein [Planctomycetaceae bacterium]
MNHSTSGGAFKLRYLLDHRPVEVVLDQPVVTLGRSPECTVVFPDTIPGISRHHATITRDAQGWIVSDAGSRNGTFVNQTAVKRHRLADGDVVNLGPLTLSFQVMVAPPRKAADRIGPSPFDASSVVEISRDAPPPAVSVSINLADMSKQLGGTLHDSIGGKLEGLANRVYPMEEDRPAGGDVADRTWGINLFSQIGEALLSTTDLDEMLSALMDLVFSNVPGQRGVFCLYDERSGELTPQVFKTRDERTQRSLKISDTITREAISSKRSLLINDVMSESKFAEAASIRALNITSAMCVPLYHDGRISGLIYVDTQSRQQPFQEEHLKVMSVLSLFSAVAVEQARLRDEVLRQQRMREHLSRYHSPNVVDEILRRAESGTLLADEKEVSVLFADLCGFTPLSERLTPTQVVQLLNSVFELLSEAVFEYDGSLDKFMGDGMLAYFGAPLEQKDHAARAVRTALEMQEKLAGYNESRPPDQRVLMRIGINSGPVIVGDIGTLTRKDYTVIGDTVNVASRLESQVAAPGQVVIGPATYDRVKDLFVCTALEPRKLKGKGAAIRPFLVDAPTQPEESASATSLVPTDMQ